MWGSRASRCGRAQCLANRRFAEARDARDAARKLVRAGTNPIEAKSEKKKADAGRRTFGELADEFIAAKSSEWRSRKHHSQWVASLTQDATPLRAMPVDAIEAVDVLKCLKPLWMKKQESASWTRGRIEAVLNCALARGLRSGENPARWKSNLSHLLPKRTVLSRVHHTAMAYEDVPAFIEKLRGVETSAAMALEFTILTAARAGEVYGARWDEIDIAAKVWTIPAMRMKAGREHRVPLADWILQHQGAGAWEGFKKHPGELHNLRKSFVPPHKESRGGTTHVALHLDGRLIHREVVRHERAAAMHPTSAPYHDGSRDWTPPNSGLATT